MRSRHAISGFSGTSDVPVPVKPVAAVVVATTALRQSVIVLSRPGPVPRNRLAMMVVIPEPVTRLAVLVLDVPEGWKVTITNRLVTLMV